MLEFIKDWPLLRHLFSKIPGPIFAKLTRLWKLYHLLSGTYAGRLTQLHSLHGPLVQVAPREYSWQFHATDRHQLLDLDKKTSRATGLVKPEALQLLRDVSQMDKLYRNEHLLQACNQQFLDLLANAAKDQKPVDLANLLTRYAYEVMIAMTTDKRAGFLEESPSTQRIACQLLNWKFYSVVYGTFLRYHPYIKSFLKTMHFHSQAQSPLDPVMDVLGKEPVTHEDTDDSVFPIRDREARVALVLAGADPTIKIMLEVFNIVSEDQALQQQLCEELSFLTQPPTFHSLVRNKASVPLLHALVGHEMRHQKLMDTGLGFVAPKGGVRIGNSVVLEGETITITSFAKSDDIRSPEAREPGLAPELNRHLPAYNLWYPDHRLKDCQHLLAAKLVAQVMQRFKINQIEDGRMYLTSISDAEDTETAEQRAGESSDSHAGDGRASPMSAGDEQSVHSTISSARATDGLSTDNERDSRRPSSDAPLSLSDMEVLHENLGPNLTAKLLDIFDPVENSVYGKDIIMVGPIGHSAARHNLHQAIEHIYGRRVKHVTDAEEIMYIAAGSTYLTNFNSKKWRGSRKNQRQRTLRNGVIHPWYKDIITAARPSVSPTLSTASTASGPSTRPASTSSGSSARPHIPTGPRAESSSHSRPQSQVPQDAKWTGWASDENKKAVEAKTLESYRQQREQQLAAEAAAAKDDASKPTIRIKETFRQTAPSSTGTNSKKSRQIVHNETTVHDADGSITVSGDGVMLPQETIEEKAPPAPRQQVAGWLPPHKRAAVAEQQRLADESAASGSNASEPKKKSSSPLSASATLFRPANDVSTLADETNASASAEKASSPLSAYAKQFHSAAQGDSTGTLRAAETNFSNVAPGTLGFFGFSPSGTVTPVQMPSPQISGGVSTTLGEWASAPPRADSPAQATKKSSPYKSRITGLVRSTGSMRLSTSSASDDGSSASLWGILDEAPPTCDRFP